MEAWLLLVLFSIESFSISSNIYFSEQFSIVSPVFLFYRFKPDWKHANKVHKLNSPFGDQFYWTVKSIQQTKGSQNWHKNLTTWYEYVERPNEPASVSGNFAGYFSVSPSPIWVILNEQANNGCWSSFWALFTWSHARVFFLSFLYCLSHNL